MNTAAIVNLANGDQTPAIRRGRQFPERRCVRALRRSSITGSSSANTITGGSGIDIIDGAGGADIIAAGGGNDTVFYYGTETSIDGSAGSNTLLLLNAVTVNLGNADGTTSDSITVANFQNTNASALSLAVSITGSSAVNSITGGSGNDSIDGAGGADMIAAGCWQRHRHLPGQRNLDRRWRRHRHAGPGRVRRHHRSEFLGGGGLGPDHRRRVGTTNFENVDASTLGSKLTVTGSSWANTITSGSGNDIIDGGGGADVITAGAGNDSVSYRGSETSIEAAPAATRW